MHRSGGDHRCHVNYEVALRPRPPPLECSLCTSEARLLGDNVRCRISHPIQAPHERWPYCTSSVYTRSVRSAQETHMERYQSVHWGLTSSVKNQRAPPAPHGPVLQTRTMAYPYNSPRFRSILPSNFEPVVFETLRAAIRQTIVKVVMLRSATSIEQSS
jgi:hypothetical protein